MMIRDGNPFIQEILKEWVVMYEKGSSTKKTREQCTIHPQ